MSIKFIVMPTEMIKVKKCSNVGYLFTKIQNEDWKIAFKKYHINLLTGSF